MGDNDALRSEMQQILVEGSFEGCLVNLYFYQNATSWYLDRQIMTVSTVIDPTTSAQRVMWNTVKELSLSFAAYESLIPCSHETLYYHPYEKFFFYYLKNAQIVSVDRGFTSTTGNACSTTVTPTSINVFTTPLSNANYMTPPAFYKGYTYISYDHSSNSRSYILRWDITMAADGLSVATNTLTQVMTGVAGKYIRDLYGMDDVGLFYVYSGNVGYYITKIDSTTGAVTTTATYETAKTWAIYQAPYSDESDLRPVWLTDTSEPGKFYKGTNVLTQHFVDTTTRYDFFAYPVEFGKYYAMQVKPGTCAEETAGPFNYDKIHVNVLSIRDQAHSYCIDDSTDIYCGNSKWEEYNLEECDDGNNANDDGCSSTCKIEARWVCVNTVNATSTCSYTPCGNGFYDNIAAPYNYGEQCDDGNTVDGDGCSSTCTIEDCYFCTTASPSVCTKQCENGVYNSNTYWNGVPTPEV